MSTQPSVLFVCVHNAGRSQMAAGYLRHLAGDRVQVRSAGSEPADQVNPVAVTAMAEDGIDIAGQQPTILTTEAVQISDVVITMGCGDACPFYPGKRYEDWVLDDPPARTSRPSVASATRSGSESKSSSLASPSWSALVHDRRRTSPSAELHLVSSFRPESLLVCRPPRAGSSTLGAWSRTVG